jgi:hypothetical protein
MQRGSERQMQEDTQCKETKKKKRGAWAHYKVVVATYRVLRLPHFEQWLPQTLNFFPKPNQLTLIFEFGQGIDIMPIFQKN